MPGAGTDIQDWFRSLPFFTKYWFGGSVLFTLLGNLGHIQINHLHPAPLPSLLALLRVRSQKPQSRTDKSNLERGVQIVECNY